MLRSSIADNNSMYDIKLGNGHLHLAE